MKIESQKAKEISAYLKAHSSAEIGKWPIEIGGQKRIMPFYRLPFDLLSYNANNGRLAMDRREWEEKNGRELDGHQPGDGTIIRDMLLDLDEDKTKTLKTDLHQKGQMEPGVITHDGIVINGNRRMAVLELLHKEEPTGKWRVLEAVQLPPDISERDLWKIEAGLQLSKDKVAEYHPVNELLKIKEGIDRGLSPEEVAAAMYAWAPREVKKALERLRLIELFLEFFGQPRNYGIIKTFGLHEYFIDLQDRVLAPAVRAGLAKRQRHKRLLLSFALVRAGILVQARGKSKRKGFTHRDIRNLDRVFSDPRARSAFADRLEQAKNMLAVPEEDVIEGFRDSVEILRMTEERDKPLRLIERAINALKSIDRKSEHFRGDRLAEGIDQLLDLVEDVRQELSAQQVS